LGRAASAGQRSPLKALPNHIGATPIVEDRFVVFGGNPPNLEAGRPVLEQLASPPARKMHQVGAGCCAGQKNDAVWQQRELGGKT